MRKYLTSTDLTNAPTPIPAANVASDTLVRFKDNTGLENVGVIFESFYCKKLLYSFTTGRVYTDLAEATSYGIGVLPLVAGDSITLEAEA